MPVQSVFSLLGANLDLFYLRLESFPDMLFLIVRGSLLEPGKHPCRSIQLPCSLMPPAVTLLRCEHLQASILLCLPVR